MKQHRVYALSGLALLLFSVSDCTQNNDTVFKGKLEVAGMCMNYTISVQEGNPGPVAAAWTDSTTGLSYRNVFRLANPCTFPPTLKQGDSFRFVIDKKTGNDCAVCMAFYPTPAESLSIKVIP